MLLPNNEWEFQVMSGMVSMLGVVVNRNGAKIQIAHELLEKIISNKDKYFIEVAESVNEVILLVQEPEHYFVVLVNLETKSVKLFDNPCGNQKKGKRLDKLMITLGGSVKRIGNYVLSKEEIQILSPCLEVNFKKDCGAHCILNIMKLSGYCEQNQIVKENERRKFVTKTYLQLVMNMFESGGCLKHAFDKPNSVMEPILSLKTIPKMLSILFEKFDSIILPDIH
jgi:hypothetical protein